MSQRNKALLAVATVVVLIVAFLALRPGDDNDDNTSASSADTTLTTMTQAAPTETTDDATDTAPATTTTPAPKPKPAAPKVTTIKAVGLKPVGGVKSIKVKKNDTVRFNVTSDQPENVHLHGYDVEKPVAPGKPAKYSFKANIEGIFEVELENSGVQLIKLTVEP